MRLKYLRVCSSYTLKNYGTISEAAFEEDMLEFSGTMMNRPYECTFKYRSGFTSNRRLANATVSGSEIGIIPADASINSTIFTVN